MSASDRYRIDSLKAELEQVKAELERARAEDAYHAKLFFGIARELDAVKDENGRYREALELIRAKAPARSRVLDIARAALAESAPEPIGGERHAPVDAKPSKRFTGGLVWRSIPLVGPGSVDE